MIAWAIFRNSWALQAAAALAVVWAALGANNLYQRQVGALKAVAKIEKATDNATDLGSSAAARSLDKRVLGKRDPTTRND